MKIGATDDFEHLYMQKFRQLAGDYGLFVEYERDRAGRDIGLHLTQPASSSTGKIVTPVLIWLQMKGLMRGTLSLAEFQAGKEVSVVLETAHLRFWYINPQPTYLALYIESADCFLAIDIKDWVRRNFDEKILTFGQKTITVKIDLKNRLDDHFFQLVLRRNLVPALRGLMSDEDDENITNFLLNSSVVKWLAAVEEAGGEAQIRVIKWMSKMRTEVYFESRHDGGDWNLIRRYWQFAMGDIARAFPFLALAPKCKVIEQHFKEPIDYYLDDDEIEITRTRLVRVECDNEDSSWWDDEEEIEGEGLLAIGDKEYSYAEMKSGEMAEHEICITLNEVGKRWADSLEVLERAEVISVVVAPDWISVAPWHARDV